MMIDNKAAAKVGGRHFAALQGAKAFWAGIPWTECPHKGSWHGSLKGAWLAGWNAAQDQRQDA